MSRQFLKALFTNLLLGPCLYLTSQAQTKDPLKASQTEVNRQLFPGAKLPAHYRFAFPYAFEEYLIPTPDRVSLSGLRFSAKTPKGVIFYLHGSHDALNVWGKLVPAYTRLQYDVFMLDYRGYGKSEGLISSEQQLHTDVQTAYDYVKRLYAENQIVILGHSIGTGLAARLAARNHPGKLILQAPYYSIADWLSHVAPSLDTTSLTYKLLTYRFVRQTKAPILLIHGRADQAIYYGSSLKLKAFLKPTDRLILLKGVGHTKLVDNEVYKKALRSFLR